jgi:hypothetical protein
MSNRIALANGALGHIRALCSPPAPTLQLPLIARERDRAEHSRRQESLETQA